MRKGANSVRSVRIFLGLGLIAAGIYLRSWWGAVGAVPLIIAAVDVLHGLFTFRELRF